MRGTAVAREAARARPFRAWAAEQHCKTDSSRTCAYMESKNFLAFCRGEGYYCVAA